MIKYSKEIETSMLVHYNTLSQKDKRRYAWIEAKKLWYWGFSYISKVLDCNINTVRAGVKELREIEETWKDKRKGKGRLSWWWRPEIIKKHPEILQDFDKVIEVHTAGSPTNPNLKRTNMKPPKIAKKVNELKRWYEVSVYIIKKVMVIRDMWLRKISKTKTFKSVPNRDEQFLNIKEKVDEFYKAWKPVLSTDVKKKKTPDC